MVNRGVRGADKAVWGRASGKLTRQPAEHSKGWMGKGTVRTDLFVKEAVMLHCMVYGFNVDCLLATSLFVVPSSCPWPPLFPLSPMPPPPLLGSLLARKTLSIQYRFSQCCSESASSSSVSQSLKR